MGPGLCAFSSSSRAMRKCQTVINPHKLMRCPVLLLLRICMASLAGAVGIKSFIVDDGGNPPDTNSTLSHFLWLKFLEIAVLLLWRRFWTLLASRRDRSSMFGKPFVLSATLLIINYEEIWFNSARHKIVLFQVWFGPLSPHLHATIFSDSANGVILCIETRAHFAHRWRPVIPSLLHHLDLENVRKIT